ncbi:MAG: hypothetical protein F4094_03690 [Synechococcus sp. SB0672_bin_6]|nr:hypothetical protein [Synechococcus sp. SB0672_bin_6]
MGVPGIIDINRLSLLSLFLWLRSTVLFRGDVFHADFSPLSPLITSATINRLRWFNIRDIVSRVSRRTWTCHRCRGHIQGLGPGLPILILATLRPIRRVGTDPFLASRFLGGLPLATLFHRAFLARHRTPGVPRCLYNSGDQASPGALLFLRRGFSASSSGPILQVAFGALGPLTTIITSNRLRWFSIRDIVNHWTWACPRCRLA